MKILRLYDFFILRPHPFCWSTRRRFQQPFYIRSSNLGFELVKLWLTECGIDTYDWTHMIECLILGLLVFLILFCTQACLTDDFMPWLWLCLWLGSRSDSLRPAGPYSGPDFARVKLTIRLSADSQSTQKNTVMSHANLIWPDFISNFTFKIVFASKSRKNWK